MPTTAQFQEQFTSMINTCFATMWQIIISQMFQAGHPPHRQRVVRSPFQSHPLVSAQTNAAKKFLLQKESPLACNPDYVPLKPPSQC